MIDICLLGSSEKLSFHRETGNILSNSICQILFDGDSFGAMNDELKILIPVWVTKIKSMQEDELSKMWVGSLIISESPNWEVRKLTPLDGWSVTLCYLFDLALKKKMYSFPNLSESHEIHSEINYKFITMNESAFFISNRYFKINAFLKKFADKTFKGSIVL